MNKKLLKEIIDKLQTRTNITKGLDNYKTFNVDRTWLNKFGKDDIFSTLKELENNPNVDIAVKWSRMGTKIVDVEKFKIRMNCVSELCRIAGVENVSDTLNDASVLYEKYLYQNKNTWLCNYYESKLNSISKGTIPKEAFDNDFHKGLYALVKNSDFKYYRTFSQEVFHKSKEFEKKYRSSYAGIIKNYNPCADNDMEDYELLELCNLYSYGQTFNYLGDMAIVLNNSVSINGVGVYTGMMLNTKTMRDVISVSISDSVKRIVTIENKDNFYSTDYDAETLYVYVHGFMSKIEQRLCGLINNEAINKGISIFHWGDMDLGGIRIYGFMKKIFPTIQPDTFMSVDEYMKLYNSVPGEIIGDDYLKKLESVEAFELEDLKNVILKYKKKFEQEEQV